MTDKYRLNRETNIAANTLPPIRELSATDLSSHNSFEDAYKSHKEVERSMTPTTDSAINMSRSVSSSEDESNSHKSRNQTPSIYEVADRISQIILKAGDAESFHSNCSSSDQTLHSSCTVLTSTTPTEEPVLTIENLQHTLDKQERIIANRKDDAITNRKEDTTTDRKCDMSKSPIVLERLAARSHRSRSASSKGLDRVTPNVYTIPSRSQLNPIVGDEVEMEIVLTPSSQV